MDINWVGPINQLGYGVASYNLLRSLVKAGHKVALFPLGNVSWPKSEESMQLINNALKLKESFNRKAPSIRVWHQFELDMFPSDVKIGFPIFELDKFSETERHHLNSLDYIFVCSAWAKQVLENNNIRVPSFVIPLGVDNDRFFYEPDGHNQRQYWNKSATIFMNVGKWEVRKGHDELCAAFNAAFSPSDNVELWMMNDNPFIGHENFEWRKKFAVSSMGNRVKFFDRIDDQFELRKIFAQIDAGVFPAKAEGFNLEPLEMMACGAHIIATNYSGHTEYMNERNARLLEVTGMELAQDGKWFHGQGAWATFSLEQLVDEMRKLHSDKQSGTLSYNKSGIETAKRLSWDNCAAKLANVLEEIMS